MPRSRGIYNKIYTPERWEEVNPENKEILEDFLAEYRQQKKSKGTIDGYFQDLRIIMIHILLKFKNKSVLEMNKKDFRNLSLIFTDDCSLSSNRTNRMKSAINSLLTYCEDDDNYDYDVNYAKKVKGVPREKVKTNDDDFFITFKEFIQVRDKLLEQGDLQCAAMWSLAYDSAGRRNEVYQVVKTGILDGNKTNVVRGKRGKLFPLVFLDDTKEIIRQYLEQRGEDDIESLWIKGTGNSKSFVDKEVLYYRILKCAKILSEIRGEECNLFFHSLRHSRVECLLQGDDDRLKDSNGNNRKFSLEEVMVLCHHSDVSTTQSYAKNHDEDTINEMFGFKQTQ